MLRNLYCLCKKKSVTLRKKLCDSTNMQMPKLSSGQEKSLESAGKRPKARRSGGKVRDVQPGPADVPKCPGDGRLLSGTWPCTEQQNDYPARKAASDAGFLEQAHMGIAISGKVWSYLILSERVFRTRSDPFRLIQPVQTGSLLVMLSERSAPPTVCEFLRRSICSYLPG